MPIFEFVSKRFLAQSSRLQNIFFIFMGMSSLAFMFWQTENLAEAIELVNKNRFANIRSNLINISG